MQEPELVELLGLGKEGGKSSVHSPTLLEEQGLGRRLHERFPFYLGSRARKALCAEGGWPALGGGRVMLGPEACSLGDWTMEPLVVGLRDQMAPSVVGFLSQEACDPKTLASCQRGWACHGE